MREVKKVGRPRKGAEKSERFSVRLEPEAHEKIILSFGSLRAALEYVIDNDLLHSESKNVPKE